MTTVIDQTQIQQQNLEQMLGGIVERTRQINDILGLSPGVLSLGGPDQRIKETKLRTFVSDVRSLIEIAEVIERDLATVLEELRTTQSLLRPTGPPF